MSSVNKLLINKVPQSLPIEKEKTKESNNQLVKASLTALHILSGSSESSCLTASTDTPPITPIQARAAKNKLPRAVSNVEKALGNLIEAAKGSVGENRQTTLATKQSSSAEIKKVSKKKQDPSIIFEKIKLHYQKYFDQLPPSSRLSEKQLVQIIKTAFTTKITDNKSQAYYLGFIGESLSKGDIKHDVLDFEKKVLVRHKQSGKIRFYVTLKNLGRGTYGVVDQVIKFHSSKNAALKLDRTNKSSVAQEYAFFKKFKAKLNGQMPLGMQEAPRAIKIYNSSIDRSEILGLLYPVYNLGSLIHARQDLSLKEKLETCRQLIDFFTKFYELEISHSDIKPGNILLDNRDGLRADIADWGSAKFKEDLDDIQEHTTEYTFNQDFIDRIEATSKEESFEISHYHDVFSMGCTLFYLFTGKEVYQLEGCTKNMFAISFKDVADLCDRSSGKKIDELLKKEGTPPSIISLISKMLNPDYNIRKEWQQNALNILTVFPTVIIPRATRK